MGERAIQTLAGGWLWAPTGDWPKGALGSLLGDTGAVLSSRESRA